MKPVIDNFPGISFVVVENDYADIETTPHYPSSYGSANLISVTSSDEADGMRSFSNYGATTVGITASGSNICQSVI